MQSPLNFNCAATIIASLPDIEPAAACEKISRFLVDLPAWPQLPRRSYLENMYAQYSEGFPGVIIADQKISVERKPDFDHLLEQLYSDSAENRSANYAIDKKYAAGLHYFASMVKTTLPLVKGQITGPISWGLCVTDSSGRGIVYDETLAEAVSKFLKLKAAWQEALLSTIARQTVIFIDEPYLSSLGSAFVSLSNEQISSSISEVLSGIKGLKGIHCCGGTDWSLLLNLPIDIISFDAYSYLDSILCYQAELSSFIKKGKAIAWGIVPNDEDILSKESVSSLFDRFGEALAPLTRDGISIRELVRQSILTPTCGLVSLSPDAVEFAFNMLSELTARIRLKYSS